MWVRAGARTATLAGDDRLDQSTEPDPWSCPRQVPNTTQPSTDARFLERLLEIDRQTVRDILLYTFTRLSRRVVSCRFVSVH